MRKRILLLAGMGLYAGHSDAGLHGQRPRGTAPRPRRPRHPAPAVLPRSRWRPVTRRCHQRKRPCPPIHRFRRPTPHRRPKPVPRPCRPRLRQPKLPSRRRRFRPATRRPRRRIRPNQRRPTRRSRPRNTPKPKVDFRVAEVVAFVEGSIGASGGHNVYFHRR